MYASHEDEAEQLVHGEVAEGCETNEVDGDEGIFEEYEQPDDLGLIERIGTDADHLVHRSKVHPDPRFLLRRFQRRERILQGYLAGTRFGFLGGLRWSVSLIALLWLYRYASAIGWVGIPELAVMALFVLAVLPWLSIGHRDVPCFSGLGGCQVPMENSFPVGPFERSKTRFKAGALKMVVGLPVVVLALFVAPFEIIGGDGLRLKFGLVYGSWFLLLPASSALCAQNGFVSSDRRWGSIVVLFNLLLVLASMCALIATMVTAWVQTVFLWLPLAACWILAAGTTGLFRCWLRAGYFELRPRDQS